MVLRGSGSLGGLRKIPLPPKSIRKGKAYLFGTQKGSLCCGNADEAKTLIPSLTDKIKDEDLQDLLDEIAKLQNR